MRKIVVVLISFFFILSCTFNAYALENTDANELNKVEDSETNQELENDENQKEINDANENDIQSIESNENQVDDVKIKEDEAVEENPVLSYTTHVQDYGWLGYVNDGAFSGTQGKSKRLEGIKIRLDAKGIEGNISYSTHVQDYGWMSYVSNDQLSGTTGQSKRLEAIKIKLTGQIANQYDIYYRVHVQDYGWLSWAKNGQAAGSATYSKRLEAIEIKLVAKEIQFEGDTSRPFVSPGIVYYKSHVQDYGWLSNVSNGNISGTVGKSKRMEALKMNLDNSMYDGNIEYSAHIQDIGWQSYKKNGALSGTEGKSKSIEAVKIRLTGEIAQYFDVYYRVHVENFGWLSWTCNNSKAGTEGLSLKVEAIQIKLVNKGSFVGDTSKPYITIGNVHYQSHVQDYGWLKTSSNGNTNGTIGKAKRIEAIKISLGDNYYDGNIEYSTHVQDYGWTNYVRNGQLSGTEGESKRVEAIKIKLTGDIANHYNVCYRSYVQNYGWLDWTCNDRVSGTIGGSYRIEAIQVKLMPKEAGGASVGRKSMLSFISKNGFLVVKDANNTLYEDAQSLLGLPGSYVLRVNKTTNVVTVLIKDGNGNSNIAYKRFVCSVGEATPLGTFYTPAKYRWHELMGPCYGQWCTRIVSGILFHSVFYSKMNNRTLSVSAYNKLGVTASHGCVRLTCGDAKWIYDNCVLKTKVIIVASHSDPLSKPSAQKLPSWHTWDPTDPTIR